jgi:hypothetical protein
LEKDYRRFLGNLCFLASFSIASMTSTVGPTSMSLRLSRKNSSISAFSASWDKRLVCGGVLNHNVGLAVDGEYHRVAGFSQARNNFRSVALEMAPVLDVVCEVQHVGMVCEVRAAVGLVRIPWVLSKWGSTIGEYLHRWDDVPYAKFGYTLRIEIRTDRP